jgi:magnesium-protoporphyrin O-methyltransferase
MTLDLVEHKQRLHDYFNGHGFARWQAIYGDAELSGVRRTIRAGHGRMVSIAEAWLLDGAPAPRHILDAGCGTGLLSLALARRGCSVLAVDLAAQMCQATQAAADAADLSDLITTSTSDLAQITGTFDAVACLDVLIHYPQPGFNSLLTQLAARTNQRLVFTYAPAEPLLRALHWIGGYFPRNERRTTIALQDAKTVDAALANLGMQRQRSARISAGFYHVTVVEAVKR